MVHFTHPSAHCRARRQIGSRHKCGACERSKALRCALRAHRTPLILGWSKVGSGGVGAGLVTVIVLLFCRGGHASLRVFVTKSNTPQQRLQHTAAAASVSMSEPLQIADGFGRQPSIPDSQHDEDIGKCTRQQ